MIMFGKISKVLVTELQVNNLLKTGQKSIKTNSVDWLTKLQNVEISIAPLSDIAAKLEET